MSTMQVWEQLSLLGLCPEEMWGVSKPQQGSRYCTHVMATSPTHAQEILVWGVKTEASPSWGFPVCCVGEKAFRAARNSMEEAPFVCWLGWWHLLTRRHLMLACPGWPTSQVWSWLTTTNPFSAVGKASYKTWSSWQRSRKAGRNHVGWLQAHLVQAPSWSWCHQEALGIPPMAATPPKIFHFYGKQVPTVVQVNQRPIALRWLQW